jgi:uncharacterized membrane protein YphA (DoxX/SURF4 family)
MHTAIWVLQVLLAATFAAAGLLKLTRPIDALARTIGAWVRDVPAPLIRVIGGLEVAGAVGLIVPSALGILPWLTALSAAGLVIVMMGALVVHLRRREPQSIAVNVVLALLAAAIVWGQTGPYLSTSHLPDCNAPATAHAPQRVGGLRTTDHISRAQSTTRFRTEEGFGILDRLADVQCTSKTCVGDLREIRVLIEPISRDVPCACG